MQKVFDLCRRAAAFRWPGRTAIVACGLLGMLLPAAFGLVVGIPEPHIHDEFSYLLAADTFAHGRLTNPTPPSPEFFEAEHVLVVPTYMSKYPPGQGLILAAGQVLFGHPIWGVWLSCGLFAASLCWMLQAWVSPRWAVMATLLAIISFGISSYWAQSYWGGMPGACGGALLFGGMRRTLRHATFGTSLLMGLGIVLLADTRPFEGLLACVPVAAILCFWLVTNRSRGLLAKFTCVVLPLVVVLGLGGWANATYNKAVTGDWKSLPYAVHLKQYFHQGVFIFSDQYPPERIPHERLAKFYADHKFVPYRRASLIAVKLLYFVPSRLQALLACTVYEMAYGGVAPGVSLAWIGVLMLVGLRSRWGWFCGGMILYVVVGQSFIEYWHAHYAAPVVPLILALLAASMRRLYHGVRSGRRAAVLTPGALTALACCCLAINCGGFVLGGLFKPSSQAAAATDGSARDLVASREQVLHRLNEQKGMHLVFVRYSPNFSTHQEWVFNEGDLKGARVIFAHDFGDDRNRELMARFSTRSAWLCQVAIREKRLVPYPAPADMAQAAVSVGGKAP